MVGTHWRGRGVRSTRRADSGATTRRRITGAAASVVALGAALGSATVLANADSSGDTVTGRVLVAHQMPLDGNGEEHEVVQIVEADGTTFTVTDSPVAEELASKADSVVVAEGNVDGAHLNVESFSTAAAPPVAAAITGQKRVKIVMLKYQQDSEYWSTDAAAVRSIVMDGPRSLAHIWATESRGAVSVSADVVYAPALPATWRNPQGQNVEFNKNTCPWVDWSQYLGEGPPRPNDGYDYVLLVAPKVRLANGTWSTVARSGAPGCGWAGIAWVTQDRRYAISAYVDGLIDPYALSNLYVPHELGHNLALSHARTIMCWRDGFQSGPRVSAGPFCRTAHEYGDHFAHMGYSACGYTAFERARAGWNVVPVDPAQSQTVQLRAIDLASGGLPHVIRLPRTPTADEGRAGAADTEKFGTQYYVEWRRDVHDACNPYANDGLQIRTVASPGNATYLVDATVNTTTYDDATLNVGQTFVDAASNVSVTLQALDLGSGVATVAISRNGTTPTTTTPPTTTPPTTTPPTTTPPTSAPPATTPPTSAPPTTNPPTGGQGVNVINGELRVAGDNGASTITVTDVAGGVVVTDNRALQAGAGCTSNGPNAVRCTGAASVVVDAGAGNDVIATATALPTTVRGGPGNDTLNGGSAADGPTRFDGGDGIDHADYSARTTALKLAIGTQANDGAAGERDNIWRDVEQVTGGAGNDRIIGSNANNVLRGGGGDDVIDGLGGRDSLVGDDGADVLRGGGNDDTISGGNGDDNLIGGSGVDTITAGAGNDVVRGKDRKEETLDCGTGGNDEVRPDRNLDHIVACEVTRYG